MPWQTHYLEKEEKKKPPVNEVTVIGHRYSSIGSSINDWSRNSGRPGYAFHGEFDILSYLLSSIGNFDTLTVNPEGSLDRLDQCSDKVIKAKLSSCVAFGTAAVDVIYKACNVPSWTPSISANVSVAWKKIVSLGVDIKIPDGPQRNAQCTNDANFSLNKVKAECQETADWQDVLCTYKP